MEHTIAVLIDFENIAAGTEKEGHGKVDIGLIMNRLREKGRVLVARSYADWGRFSRFKQSLMFEGVTLFELSAHGMQDKNRADVALVVDCLELAFTRPHLDTFVVVSGDSDFTPLIMKLRELNKRVLGVGTRRSTSRLIVEACDEFIFYETLRSTKTQRSRRGQDEEARPLSREEAMELVAEALAALQREDPRPVLSGIIKEAVLRKEPAFSEADLGYSSFARFLEACEKEGIVRLTKDPKGGGYMVDSPDSEPAQPAPPSNNRSLGGDARRLYDRLVTEELEPLDRARRQLICEEIAEIFEERKKKGKRMNLQWTIQDVAKALKDKAITQRHVKAVVNALHAYGVFLHSDGEPVRSFFANYRLDADVPALMKAADLALLRRLRSLDPEANSATLAELLLDDAGRNREIEELIAWELLAPEPERKPEPAEDEDTRGGPAEAAEGSSDDDSTEGDGEGRRKRRRRRRRKGGNGDSEAEGNEAAPETSSADAAPAPVVEEAPAAPAPEPEAELPPEESGSEDGEPAKKRAPRRRRAPRKGAE